MSDRTLQPATIVRVLPDSIAAEIGFEPGDRLVSINGTPPRDLIDYRFLCADEFLELEVLDSRGRSHQVEIEKDFDEDLGLEFENALFDGLIQCNNHCPFCFIDQQPPGKRASLYLKDDDYRLSFLYGSYLTLTNLTPKEWERIDRLRLSPLYVSVHATEPEVRTQLLKNPRAAQIRDQLAWFQAHELPVHTQVVVCPGINDGVHLERTLRDLAHFHAGEVPGVLSAAVVPVGLTRFRPSADELRSVTPADAAIVIEQVTALQEEFLQTYGTRLAWLADEWFLIAGQPLPPVTIYEDFPQLEDGVGSIRSFLQEFRAATEDLPARVTPDRCYTWVVGNVVEQAFGTIADRLNGVTGLEVRLVGLASDYWGQALTVTGLLTGQDLLAGLADRDLGDGILLPSVMLQQGTLETAENRRFLDDMTVAEVADRLQTPVLVCEGIEGLLSRCLRDF
ncbi:MAG: TIGR03279 family radical SAM protein [Prochlorothrix sp.]|nr:TIGR03279 family radical SAM protein [Prochlorothrix sp.]